MAAELRDDTFRRIAALMHAAVGLALPDTKKPLIRSRLVPRLERLGLASFDDYAARIESRDTEFQVAVDLLTTNETYFFREAAHFELLEHELARTRPRRFAAWSAACSFGDEAYSIAMVLADLQRQGRVGEDWSVLGTDVSDRVLRAAVSGIVAQERLREVPAVRLQRHCLRGEAESEGLAMIKPSIRDRVRFGQLNLCRPIEPIGPFDAVFLRNVLIYFDAPTKAEVVERVLAQLRPGGLFFIGTAEGRVFRPTSLQPVAPGVYRKGGA